LEKKEVIRGLIENFLEPAGKKFVEELVFRFLLIHGDSFEIVVYYLNLL